MTDYVKKVKLKEILDIRDGTHESPKYVNNGYPLVTSKNLKNGKIDFSNVNLISRENLDKINKRSRVDNGDIIMPMIGTVGNPVIVNTQKQFAIKNVALFKCCSNDNIDNNYLYYFLKSPLFYQQIDKFKRGGTQSFISLSDIRNLEIPVYDLTSQRAISFILKKSESLINKRQIQLNLLSSLAQSIFLEMFGDPFTNPKSYPEFTIESLAQKEKGAIKAGPFGSQLLKSELVDKGIPVFGIENVGINHFIYIENKAITPQKFEQLKSFQVKERDVLISRTGTVGRTCVTPNITGIIGPNLLKISLDESIIKPEYLSHIFNYVPMVIDQIKRSSPGATVSVFNTKNLKAIKIIVPSIEEQRIFVNKINKIEHQKNLLENSNFQFKNNFNNLLQQAFKGEIFKN